MYYDCDMFFFRYTELRFKQQQTLKPEKHRDTVEKSILFKQ